MKRQGTIQSGPYAGQQYRIAGKGVFPRWLVVSLADAEGRHVYREVREEVLEVEYGS